MSGRDPMQHPTDFAEWQRWQQQERDAYFLGWAWVLCEEAVPHDAILRCGRVGAGSRRGWVTVYLHGDVIHSEFADNLADALRATALHFKEGTQGE